MLKSGSVRDGTSRSSDPKQTYRERRLPGGSLYSTSFDCDIQGAGSEPPAQARARDGPPSQISMGTFASYLIASRFSPTQRCQMSAADCTRRHTPSATIDCLDGHKSANRGQKIGVLLPALFVVQAFSRGLGSATFVIADTVVWEPSLVCLSPQADQLASHMIPVDDWRFPVAEACWVRYRRWD